MGKSEIKYKQSKNSKNKKSFKSIIFKRALIVFSILGIMLASFLVLFFYLRPYNLQYTVKQSAGQGDTLSVNTRIKRNRIFGNDTFSFVKGSFTTINPKCVDDQNRNISIDYKDGVINIGPVSGDVKYIDFSYDVKIAEPGKHGLSGGEYDDLLVFDGESVFMFPKETIDGADRQIKKTIGSISMKFDVKDDWKSIVPYGTENKKEINIKKITWSKLYELRKASYTFGKLEGFEFKKSKGTLDIYVDPEAKEYYTADAQNGINALYDYYSKLFNSRPSKLSIVLLRKDSTTQSYIIGGLGTQTLGSTFDPSNARDWQLMGHRLFHIFFDSKVTSNAYHEASTLWFYEGLATYYENMSMNSLPENIKSSLNINTDESFRELYERYLYMKLKDPGLLGVPPTDAEKILGSGGITEFVHYTEAPLIVKYMEDLSASQYKEHDRALKYIIDKAPKDKADIDKIFNYVLGPGTSEFKENCLTVNGIIPLWDNFRTRDENRNSVIDRLNAYEYLLWTWFSSEIPGYPMDNLSSEGLTQLSKAGQNQGVHFADVEIENKVKKFSPTIYDLLEEYALRVKTVGVDPNDPFLRLKILANQTNVEKWENEKKNLK